MQWCMRRRKRTSSAATRFIISVHGRCVQNSGSWTKTFTLKYQYMKLQYTTSLAQVLLLQSVTDVQLTWVIVAYDKKKFFRDSLKSIHPWHHNKGYHVMGLQITRQLWENFWLSEETNAHFHKCSWQISFMSLLVCSTHLGISHTKFNCCSTHPVTHTRLSSTCSE